MAEPGLVDPTQFHSKRFSVDAFLVSLTKDVIGPVDKAAGSLAAGRDALSAGEQVQRVQRLLGVLERCGPGGGGQRAVRRARHLVLRNAPLAAVRSAASLVLCRPAQPPAKHHARRSTHPPPGPRARSVRCTSTTPTRCRSCRSRSTSTRRSTGCGPQIASRAHACTHSRMQLYFSRLDKFSLTNQHMHCAG